MNDLEMVMTDIGTAYFYAKCSTQFIRVRRQGIQNDAGSHVRYSASPLRYKGLARELPNMKYER
jgi:hypothetical protein